MMSNKLKWLLAGGVLILNLLFLSLAMGRMSNLPESESERVEPLNLHFGATIQRKRIVDFTTRVKEQSINELEQSLAEAELLVFDAGISPSSHDTYNLLQAVMSDRRVAKVFAAYAEMNDTEAKARSLSLFEFWMTEHASRMQQVVKEHKKTRAIDIGIGTQESNYACTAAIFLLSQFSEPADVLSALQKWRDVDKQASDAVRNPESPIDLKFLGPSESTIDLFVLNICILTLQLHLDESKVKTILNEQVKLKDRAFTKVDYIAWDGHTNPFDFTHRHRGVPYDDSKVLKKILYIRGWSSVPVGNQPGKEGLCKRAIESLHEHLGVPRE